MRYEGPIYRPPSEAGSLLIQATIGCPHNRCTFCMVYKKGPRFKIRPVPEIKEDIVSAQKVNGNRVQTLFFPAGNTIAMKTDDLSRICRFAKGVFPDLERITVYGSSQYIHRKGLKGLKQLAESGLSRIHAGLESGDDVVLKRICKGTNSRQQIEAGKWVRDAGIELSLYVILGIGGKNRTKEHAGKTATVLNQIKPDFIRLRTFVPKINTPLLEEVKSGAFEMIGPHEVLKEAASLINGLKVPAYIVSDHYTNYINIEGRLPRNKNRLLREINSALQRDETSFRPFFVGTE
jgi:radical SAM superfamily enzyme YgiQ (UPF0313 family)